MTVDVEPVPVEHGTEKVAACRVYTKDGVGTVREYNITIGTEKHYGQYVMAGREAGDDDRPNVSDTAWDAAREHFRSEGYDVK
jgi:hypothetical protein